MKTFSLFVWGMLAFGSVASAQIVNCVCDVKSNLQLQLDIEQGTVAQASFFDVNEGQAANLQPVRAGSTPDSFYSAEQQSFTVATSVIESGNGEVATTDDDGADLTYSCQ